MAKLTDVKLSRCTRIKKNDFKNRPYRPFIHRFWQKYILLEEVRLRTGIFSNKGSQSKDEKTTFSPLVEKYGKDLSEVSKVKMEEHIESLDKTDPEVLIESLHTIVRELLNEEQDEKYANFSEKEKKLMKNGLMINM